MNRFISDDHRFLNGEAKSHIEKVLRLKTGDRLIVSSFGVDYLSEITVFQDDGVLLKTVSKEQNRAEPKTKITLFIALRKGDKLDEIVRGATALG